MDVRRYLTGHEPPAFLFTPDAEFAVCCGEKGCVNAEVAHAVDGAGAIIDLRAAWRETRCPRAPKRSCAWTLVWMAT